MRPVTAAGLYWLCLFFNDIKNHIAAFSHSISHKMSELLVTVFHSAMRISHTEEQYIFAPQKIFSIVILPDTSQYLKTSSFDVNLGQRWSNEAYITTFSMYYTIYSLCIFYDTERQHNLN